MSDLLGNTNCWFSHAQIQLCLAFNGYSTLMVTFLSSALLRINEAIRTILRQEILIGRAISSRISYKFQNSSYAKSRDLEAMPMGGATSKQASDVVCLLLLA